VVDGAGILLTRDYVIPGRVELVGKHVDYGGGSSLTCAVDLSMRAVAVPLKERVLRVRQRGSRDVVELPISAAAAPTRSPWITSTSAVRWLRRSSARR
jgi:galactokinase